MRLGRVSIWRITGMERSKQVVGVLDDPASLRVNHSALPFGCGRPVGRGGSWPLALVPQGWIRQACV